jgi:hypothetical protein
MSVECAILLAISFIFLSVEFVFINALIQLVLKILRF